MQKCYYQTPQTMLKVNRIITYSLNAQRVRPNKGSIAKRQSQSNGTEAINSISLPFRAKKHKRRKTAGLESNTTERLSPRRFVIFSKQCHSPDETFLKNPCLIQSMSKERWYMPECTYMLVISFCCSIVFESRSRPFMSFYSLSFRLRVLLNCVSRTSPTLKLSLLRPRQTFSRVRNESGKKNETHRSLSSADCEASSNFSVAIFKRSSARSKSSSKS
jgi:hypothetical protein